MLERELLIELERDLKRKAEARDMVEEAERIGQPLSIEEAESFIEEWYEKYEGLWSRAKAECPPVAAEDGLVDYGPPIRCFCEFIGADADEWIRDIGAGLENEE